MIYYMSPKGRCGIENYINGRWRKTNHPEIRPISYEDLFQSRTLPSGTWIFSAVEQLQPAGKRLADAVWQTLTDAGQTVLNRPKFLPSRHGLLETMYQVGINEFRSWPPGKIDRSIRYPVFVRQAEQHNGNMSELIYSRKELDNFLWWQRLRGYKFDELLVIEFCDTCDESSVFRKYSAQYVQGEVAARYLHIDEQWMVKAHGKVFLKEWADEERDYIRRNPHAAEIGRIFDLANVEYGRIDYGLLDGRIQVWEINTNPTIGGPPRKADTKTTPEWIRKLQKTGKKIYFEKFQSMLESIDTPNESGVTIELSLPESDLQVWRGEVIALRRQSRHRGMLSTITEWPVFRQVHDIVKSALVAMAK